MYGTLLSDKDQRTLIGWFRDNLADSETKYARPLSEPAEIAGALAKSINPLFYVRSWIIGPAFGVVGKSVGAMAGLYILYRGAQKAGLEGAGAAAAAEVGLVGVTAQLGALNSRMEFASRWRDLDTERKQEVIKWLQHEFDVGAAGDRADFRDEEQSKPLTRRSLNRALKFVKHENGKTFDVESDTTGVLASNLSEEGIDILRSCCDSTLGYGFVRSDGVSDPQLLGGVLVALRDLARERSVLVRSYGIDPAKLSVFSVRAQLALVDYVGARVNENLKFGGPLAEVMDWKDTVQINTIPKDSPADTLGVGLILSTSTPV